MSFIQKAKEKYKSLTTTIAALNMLIAIGYAMVFYSVFRMVYILPQKETKRSYYTINYDKGEYQPIQGFDSPIINPTQLENYVNRVVTNIYNFDAINYLDKYRNVVSTFFKEEALNNFYAAVQPRLNTVKEGAIAVSAVPLASVQINRFGYSGKEFLFDVSVPIKITYSSKQGNYNEDILVRLTLLRVPTTTHITGLQILSLKETPFDVMNIYKLKINQ